MPIARPQNEDAILHTLNPVMQERYLEVRDAMDRVAKKYPDMDTASYTSYLESYLDKAKDFRVLTKNEAGIPFDPRAIRDLLIRFEADLQKEMDQKYPVFASAYGTDEQKAAAAKNHQATQRLHTAINGEGIIPSTVKFFYDKEKDGAQWSNMGGALVGGGSLLLIGNFIAGAAGGGWLGTILVGLLTVSGAVFGAKVAHEFFNPTPQADEKNRTPDSPKKSPQRTMEPETTYVSNELPETAKAAAKEAVQNSVAVPVDETARQHIPTRPAPDQNPQISFS